MIKPKIIIELCISIILLSGCASNAPKQTITEQSMETKSEPATETSIIDEQPAEGNTEPATENIPIEEPTISETHIEDTIYIGEYLDSDVGDPNLEIAKGSDGKYIVQIGIYRLTSLNDGIGELTADGMTFTATDAGGNPISGVITVDGQTAVVTFTDSTWDYLQNGSAFEYTKSSDTPNIWKE